MNTEKLWVSLVACLSLVFVTPSEAEDSYWKKRVIDTGGDGADGVSVADVTGDGFVDVVSGWEQSGKVLLYVNPGLPALRSDTEWKSIDVGGGLDLRGIEDAAFADLDMDGKPDAVLTSVEGDRMILGIHRLDGGRGVEEGHWKGQRVSPAERSRYMKARSGQLDGVGGAEVVAGTKSTDEEPAAVYWFRRRDHDTSSGSWERMLVGEIDGKTTTLEIRDMDTDGYPDLAYSGRNGVGWFKNPGYRVLQDHPQDARWERIVVLERGSEFTVFDLDADGLDDLLVAATSGSGMVAMWCRRLDETGRSWRVYPIRSDEGRPGAGTGKRFALKGVGCGFVDGDSVIDVVFSTSGFGGYDIGLFKMSPRTGLFSDEPWDLTPLTPAGEGNKFDNLELVDVDGDEDLDIVTTEEGVGLHTKGQGVLWFENPLKG